jgi:hypothetical protein
MQPVSENWPVWKNSTHFGEQNSAMLSMFLLFAGIDSLKGSVITKRDFIKDTDLAEHSMTTNITGTPNNQTKEIAHRLRNEPRV